MPLIRIQTNSCVADQLKFMEVLTALAAEWLGKPKRYIMVMFLPDQKMSMAGNPEPCAFVEFVSIGLAKNQIKTVSNQLTKFLSKELGVKCDRLYIEFKNADAENWSWDGSTFGS